MSREILFKAKAINRDKGYHRSSYKNGNWVYGLITRLYDGRFENLPAEMTDENGVSGIEIDHNTICQFTGLVDKNGDKIWENDIVECKNDESHFQSQIEWDKSYCGFILQDSDTSAVGLDAITKYGIYKDVQVIGNVFDNSKLVECEV